MNYTGQGDGDDYIQLNCQSRGGQEKEQGNRNNANFFSGFEDGSRGRMRMYLWDRDVVPSEYLTIESPASVAGSYLAGGADFGPGLDNPVSGQLELADPILACDTDPESELMGKIAVIDRGQCNFSEKVKRAENAGAIAAIICNNEPGFFTMAGGDFAALVTIPSIMVDQSDCEAIKLEIPNGVQATLAFPDPDGPKELDSTFDNGIIAHEYGHGISNRLTGGREIVTCLRNAEQGGEGWSDFFTLVMSTTSGNNGIEPRGIGNYVIRETTEGGGIRPWPYTTDMEVNPAVYDYSITLSVPHGVGFVWNTMLWDLYWAMVDRYGFDDDLYRGSGGNNMTVRLVMEGMKLQPCSPGFVDSRDAILAADRALYGGDNQCLIWEVFARRGLGYSAFQGSTFAREDGVQSFDIPPACVASLKVVKSMTPEVIQDDRILVELEVSNHLNETKTGVVLRDNIPQGLSFAAGTAQQAANVQNGQVVFQVGSLAPGETKTFSYRLETQGAPASQFSFRDGAENGISAWDAEGLWRISPVTVDQGEFAFFMEDPDEQVNQSLTFNSTFAVTENNAAIRFRHFYDTDPASDGGVLEISSDNGATWIDLEDKIFRGGYRGPFQKLGAFGDARSAWWGHAQDFKTTYADLSDYIGQDVKIRFRFGSDPFNGSRGWFVDDVGFISSLRSYNSEACLTTEQGDEICAEAPERGSIVLQRTEQLNLGQDDRDLKITVYPNPIDEEQVFLSVRVESDAPFGTIVFRIFNFQGIEIGNGFARERLYPIQNFFIPLTEITEMGNYIIHVDDGRDCTSGKVLVKRLNGG